MGRTYARKLDHKDYPEEFKSTTYARKGGRKD